MHHATGEQIAKELGWDRTAVVHYSQIKECLHPEAWQLARNAVTKNRSLVTEPDEDVVTPEVTIVTWRESHFRA